MKCSWNKDRKPCGEASWIIAWSCTRCTAQGTRDLCETHWDLWKWTIEESVGAGCPECWNALTAASVPLEGGTITHHGEKHETP
jgi:hypothetical protein